MKTIKALMPANINVLAMFEDADHSEMYDMDMVHGWALVEEDNGVQQICGLVMAEDGLHLCEDIENFVGYEELMELEVVGAEDSMIN